MATYKLTYEASVDLENIYDYGIDQFGLDQADTYLDQIEERLEQISEHPMMYPAANYIRQGYRRSVIGSHTIYFRIQPDYIEIMRIIGQNLV